MNPIKSYPIETFKHNIVESRQDPLIVEEPLEIRLSYCDKNNESVLKKIAVTMRTPGSDSFLAVGFLLTEGIIEHNSQIEKIEPILNDQKNSDQSFRESYLLVTLDPTLQISPKCLERHFFTSSSCGVCGKKSIDSLFQKSPYLLEPKKTPKEVLEQPFIENMLSTCYKAQKNFHLSGGVHACGLLDRNGNLLHLFEDVGRHNALDKLIGKLCFESSIPCYDKILFLSGRVSFEMVQKAAMAGCNTIISIGPPSSLALEIAKKLNFTLIGFAKDNSYNLYIDNTKR